MQDPRELRAVRLNGPILLFKQAVGSGHRAVFDIMSNSKGCARFVIGSNVRSYRARSASFGPTVESRVGVPCLGLNGGPAFKHSAAFSFQIVTDNQVETDRYWNAIVNNGGAESACTAH
jgi:predicted 3-demethylubiquinone-9 3-methyltransferase (glyoxalase superfamily)